MAEELTTVTATGIAKIAGVGRAAVSNWRRRHPDFPQPIAGTSASPAFDLLEVEQWLDEQGKLRQVSPLERVWRRIEASGSVGRLAEAISLVGMLLLAAPKDVPTPRQLAEAARSRATDHSDELLHSFLPTSWSPSQRELLDTALPLVEREDAVDAFEYLYEQYASARGTAGFADTPSAVAHLMLDLTGPATSVLDITCGGGALLRAAHQRAANTGVRAQLFGQDPNPDHVRIALLRLLLLWQRASAGTATDEVVDLHVGDPLLADGFAGQTVDAVIGNPPFGIQDWGHDQLAYDPRWAYGGLPPRTEPELAWVQHALAHLKPGGWAALMMPPAAAKRPAGRRIRGELIRRGALQAVIALPAGASTGTSIGIHLWVLQRPRPDDGPGGKVLFVDWDVAPDNRTHSPQDRLEAFRHEVASVWQSYHANSKTLAEHQDIARLVPLVELLDEDIDLTPLRHLPLADRVTRDVEVLLALPASLDTQLDALRGALPQLRAVAEPTLPNAPTATLDGLARTGALSLHRFTARTPNRNSNSTQRTDLQEPALTSQDVIAGRQASGSVPLSADDEPQARVRSHDILIPAVARTVVARVATDEQVGTRLGPGVHAVRVDPDILDPWFTAGALTRAENTRKATRTTSGVSGALRIDVKRLHLPVLPIATQRRYGEVLRRLAQWDAALTHTAANGHDITRTLTEALLNGTLAPSDHWISKHVH